MKAKRFLIIFLFACLLLILPWGIQQSQAGGIGVQNSALSSVDYDPMEMDYSDFAEMENDRKVFKFRSLIRVSMPMLLTPPLQP
jgi:hypothetical protein